MKKFRLLALLLSTTILFSFVTAPSSHNSPPPGITTVEVVDMTGFSVLIDCTGDLVTFSGNMVIINTMNVNGNSYVLHTIFNPQNLSGVGTSGARYQATGNTQFSSRGSLSNGQATEHYVNNFRIIGTGSAASYKVHDVGHTTINANGTITSTVELTNATCE